MNQRAAKAKRRSAQSRGGGKPDEIKTPPTPEPLEEVPPSGGDEQIGHPAVLVMRVPTDEPGKERIEFAELNGIDPLAVPILLRMAANIKENQLGLGERK